MGFGRGDRWRGGGGVVRLVNAAGRRRRRPAAAARPARPSAPRQSQDAVLEVGVGQQQDHRRGPLLAEVLDQSRELGVGDRVGLDGHLAGEFERGPLGVGPAGVALAAEGVDLRRRRGRRGGRRPRRRPRRRRSGWRGRRPSASRRGAWGRPGSSSAGRGRAAGTRRCSAAARRPASAPRPAAAGRRPCSAVGRRFQVSSFESGAASPPSRGGPAFAASGESTPQSTIRAVSFDSGDMGIPSWDSVSSRSCLRAWAPLVEAAEDRDDRAGADDVGDALLDLLPLRRPERQR